MVSAGRGIGVAVATGVNTEIGRITTLLGEVQQLTTPLLRQINRFGQRFTWVAMSAAVLLFLFAIYVRGFAWPDALIAVVALAVGVVPEGLPAVITITLAIGVQRMAARNAVIRRLPAVETLGATSVICSDKTGTLTRNEMTARRVVIPGDEILIAGSGHSPGGEPLFSDEGGDELGPHGTALTLIRAGLLCNDAQLRHAARAWTVHGDPMEGALVTLAMKAGFDPEDIRAEWKRVDEIPFDAQHRFMATLNRVPYGQAVILVKGAPERLLEMCSLQAGEGGEAPLDPVFWAERIAAAAAEGERVLGFALKQLSDAPDRLSFADIDEGMIFLGIVGFIDPPRDEAVAAIAECRSAGIAVKMITGDHVATAAAIARQLGLGEAPRVLTGRELDGIPEETFGAVVRDTVVIEQGDPVEAILRTAQAEDCDLVITGIARDELLGRFSLGRTVDRLLRCSRAPLLVVKDRARRPYRHIVVATDFSDASRHALEAAARFFREQRLTVFHAYDPPMSGLMADAASYRREYRKISAQDCEAFLQGIKKRGDNWLDPHVLIECGAPDHLLRDYVRDRDVDLVVLGTHGRGALFEVFIGSVAKQIMHDLPCGTLVIREPRAATES
jgi:nucleotide-binding universal stress UspA family protein